MPVHLIFLFFFQSGLTFAFSYFIAKILLKGDSGEEPGKVISGIRKVRNIIAIVTIVIPPAMYWAYYNSLPDDKSSSVALWPSLWIFMILLALVMALTIAMNQRRRHSEKA